MILGQISYLDCLVFLVFLAPQLLIHVGLAELSRCALYSLPFILFQMPYELVREQCCTSFDRRSPFAKQATLFQDIVIRCVRFAFARIPASIGAVFFSKYVALPFMRFRMLRHGYITCPIHYEEVTRPNMRGIWMIDDFHEPPDVIVYYCHGGGFSMGSSYFYLEFLLAWLSLLRASGKYANPAVFALEYTLVPNETYPTQVRETLAGYEYCLEQVRDHTSDRVCVAGDSAGATLMLSLLLILAGREEYKGKRPGFATMISPWCTLVSEKNINTPSDFLNAESLHHYARQYVGEVTPDGPRHKRSVSVNDTLASPGNCMSRDMWSRASPKYGFHFIYGAEEVFAPETRQLLQRVRQAGSRVEVDEEEAGVHAWPVVSLFLAESKEARLKGLRRIVDTMARCI